MEISGIVSRIFDQLQQNQQSQLQKSVEQAFQEILEKQQQTGVQHTIKSPKSPLNPQQLDLKQTPAFQQIYSKTGRLIELSVYKNQVQSQLSNQGNNTLLAQPLVFNPDMKWPAEILATLMQQSFQFIKENLEREQKEKRERGDSKPKLPDGKAEEDALELLEILFDQFEMADSVDEFCNWADESINRAELELREHYSELPEVVEMRFKLMHDAILALRNGIQPDYIKERLQQEILRKKENQKNS